MSAPTDLFQAPAEPGAEAGVRRRTAAAASTASTSHDADADASAAPARSKAAANDADEHDDTPGLGFPHFAQHTPWHERSWAYQFLPFRGMYYDVRRRAPYAVVDWTTAFRPHNWWTVLQGIPRMYFINLMPAIAYVLDMYHRTEGAYGINEVILASALAAIVFSVFSMQPLTFVGVTGLINLVNYTQYDIVVQYYGLSQMDYLRVQAWSLIWAAGFHFIVAAFNICDFTRFITDMTSETFGFYVGIVYIQKGIELLILEFEPLPLDNATGWLSVVIAILFTVSVYLVSAVGRTSALPFKLRSFVANFAFTAGILFWTGFSNMPENSLRRVPLERLPITRAFFPTMDRSWFIDFWNIELRWVFVGAGFGFGIVVLFYFDHQVSSVMAQARKYPVKRPAGFHWDFFLLGITTLVSGFLGLPAPNGLVPQCPWHTDSLSVFKQVSEPVDDEADPRATRMRSKAKIVNTRVVEQRFSHFAVGLLTVGTMTRPLLVALGTMPRAVFAGVFILVGWMSIEGNAITTRTLAIFRDDAMVAADDPLLKLRRSKIALFVGIQWLFFAMTFAISQTIAAIGFPIIIVLLLPLRTLVLPKWFSPEELRILDAPTADSEVVLASIGGGFGVTGKGERVARDTGIAGELWDGDDDDNKHSRGGSSDEKTRRTAASDPEKQSPSVALTAAPSNAGSSRSGSSAARERPSTVAAPIADEKAHQQSEPSEARPPVVAAAQIAPAQESPAPAAPASDEQAQKTKPAGLWARIRGAAAAPVGTTTTTTVTSTTVPAAANSSAGGATSGPSPVTAEQQSAMDKHVDAIAAGTVAASAGAGALGFLAGSKASSTEERGTDDAEKSRLDDKAAALAERERVVAEEAAQREADESRRRTEAAALAQREQSIEERAAQVHADDEKRAAAAAELAERERAIEDRAAEVKTDDEKRAAEAAALIQRERSVEDQAAKIKAEDEKRAAEAAALAERTREIEDRAAQVHADNERRAAEAAALAERNRLAEARAAELREEERRAKQLAKEHKEELKRQSKEFKAESKRKEQELKAQRKREADEAKAAKRIEKAAEAAAAVAAAAAAATAAADEKAKQHREAAEAKRVQEEEAVAAQRRQQEAEAKAREQEASAAASAAAARTAVSHQAVPSRDGAASPPVPPKDAHDGDETSGAKTTGLLGRLFHKRLDGTDDAEETPAGSSDAPAAAVVAAAAPATPRKSVDAKRSRKSSDAAARSARKSTDASRQAPPADKLSTAFWSDDAPAAAGAAPSTPAKRSARAEPAELPGSPRADGFIEHVNPRFASPSAALPPAVQWREPEL